MTTNKKYVIILKGGFMNKRKNSIKMTGFMLLLIGIMPFFTSCATIFGGGAKDKSERTADIRWGYFVLDILGGAVPLIIDFANGAIYEPKVKHSDIKKEMLNALNKNIPTYFVKSDGVYKASLNSGNIEYSKVSENELPPQVSKSLKAEVEKIKNRS